MKIAGIFNKNIKEIGQSHALQTYGAFAAATHVLSYYFWTTIRPAHWLLSNDAEPICWPFFEHCRDFRISPEAVRVILSLYGGMALVCIALFLTRKSVRTAYWILLGLEVLKTALLVQDYRLWMTHHYMTFFVDFIYLFLPDKLNAIRLIVVSFYLWAAFLKCNTTWLSGSLLRGHWGLWESTLPIQCAYVLLLELVLSWGLLSKRKDIFIAVFCQFLLFHLISWREVGFFYPTIMFCLLAVFPLSWWDQPKRKLSLFHSVFSGRQRISTYVILGVLALLQLPPYFQDQNASLRGGGRIFYSLFMFHDAVECEAELTLKSRDGSLRKVDLVQTKVYMDFRKQCEPLVMLNMARSWCLKSRRNPQFEDEDLSLRSRRMGDAAFKQVIDLKDFCKVSPRYRLFDKNDWILL